LMKYDFDYKKLNKFILFLYIEQIKKWDLDFFKFENFYKCCILSKLKKS